MDPINVKLTNNEWTQVIAALEVCGNPLAKKVLEQIVNAPAPFRHHPGSRH